MGKFSGGCSYVKFARGSNAGILNLNGRFRLAHQLDAARGHVRSALYRRQSRLGGLFEFRG